MTSDSSKNNPGAAQDQPYVADGMPPLDLTGNATSYFEFWPAWLMYFPVAILWLLLSIRYRSLSLPLLANPAVPLSGMVGVAKSKMFATAGSEARKNILAWCIYRVNSEAIESQVKNVMTLLQAENLHLPVVAKPEMGCRGVGVKLVTNTQQLSDYIKDYPHGADIQFQKLSMWEPEAGVFFVRGPGEDKGQITSLAVKYLPYVIGDGRSSLRELVIATPRAGELMSVYEDTKLHDWDHVVAEGEPYRLIFAASHSRGAIFRDAHELITDELSQKLDKIFDDIPGVHYGRLDVKFSSLEKLKRGEDFDIIEINGASAESINIWDRKTSLVQAIRTLLKQYRTLFRLGEENRKRGYEPPGLLALYKAWRLELHLVKNYP